MFSPCNQEHGVSDSTLSLYPFNQSMYRYTKRPEGRQAEDLGGFAFVPLIGHHGWNDRSLAEV